MYSHRGEAGAELKDSDCSIFSMFIPYFSPYSKIHQAKGKLIDICLHVGELITKLLNEMCWFVPSLGARIKGFVVVVVVRVIVSTVLPVVLELHSFV